MFRAEKSSGVAGYRPVGRGPWCVSAVRPGFEGVMSARAQISLRRNLHPLPVIREFFAAIEANNVRTRLKCGCGAALPSPYTHRKTQFPVPTSEKKA
jgi:hypothetical protein